MILCIDFGSTSFKVALYTPQLEVAGKGSAYLKYASLGERVELDIDQARACLRSATTQAMADAAITPDHITAVAMTSQAQTFALRTESDDFATPFISWQDGRAQSLAATMAATPFFSDFSDHCSFHEPRRGLMIGLLKMTLTDSSISSPFQILPLPSFFIEELTGESVLDENLAAMTGLYSLKEKGWHAPYLDWCGISQEQLPVVRPSHQPAGITRAKNSLGLPEGIPVFSAGNDQTAGAYAAGLEKTGGMLITLGSAQVVYQWLPEELAPQAGMVRGIFHEKGFYRMMADSLGGNLITRAVKQLGFEGFPEFFERAQLGMQNGAQLPSVAVTPTAILWGDTSASNELKSAAVVDFLCERMAGFVRQMRNDQTPLFLTDGGGARNAVWRDCLANKLGMELNLKPAAPDFGAARLVFCSKQKITC